MAGHGLPTESPSPRAAGLAKDADLNRNLTTMLVHCLHTWNKDPAQTRYDGMKGWEDCIHDQQAIEKSLVFVWSEIMTTVHRPENLDVETEEQISPSYDISTHPMFAIYFSACCPKHFHPFSFHFLLHLLPFLQPLPTLLHRHKIVFCFYCLGLLTTSVLVS